MAKLSAASAAQLVAAFAVLASLHGADALVPAATLVLALRAIGLIAGVAGAFGRRPWIAPVLALAGTAGACLGALSWDGVLPACCVSLGIALDAAARRIARIDGARGWSLAVGASVATVAAAAWMGSRESASQGAAVGVVLMTTGAWMTVGSADERRATVLTHLAALSLLTALVVTAGLSRCQAWLAGEALPSCDPAHAMARCDAVGTGWLAPDPRTPSVIAGVAAGAALVCALSVERLLRWPVLRRMVELAPTVAVCLVVFAGHGEAETVAALVLAVVAASACASLALSHGSEPAAGRSLARSTLLCAMMAAALSPLVR